MKHDIFRKQILPIVDKLFRLALNITGNKQDAEDVVQDTLFHVWQKKEKWDSIQSIEAYCFRSTRNIALNKIALKDNRQEPIPDNFDIVEQKSSSQDRLEEEEQTVMLEKCIEQLPEKQRTVFQLRTVEGFSYKQIAEVLNIPEEQVKVNLFRSRQKLKEFFNEHTRD
ncbi:MAG: RNA polymerase sigma factor [Dysgonamonadaceae bacterium]|jgi:RNA polymerase sigma-70 factor (ECF subfamily)|nr:RNA polymerase sigma factor [Dysgonamonadaceae bacterium]